ncbi:MAG: hypothetical protein DHS20C18_06420 [Saprospiraceae bacterium]|nr:MAG: hypothetical protein DHS20C18_06420 [Saprospiraceae bacterium]
MNKILYGLCSLLLVGVFATELRAGNPDRQGEAGAYELLMIPYAKMAGLHAMTTANVSGVEAIRLNVAGLGRINKTEVSVSTGRYLEGTGINMNAFGLAQKVGSNGTFGFSLMALDFGDIAVTTSDQPEGTGATFSPNFFNLGLSYAHTFENKVSVGITLRGVSESTSDISAFALAVDAGVQYVTGEKDEFKFGISLRNVGSRMRFGGEGLGALRPAPSDQYELTYETRAADFELPSMLNIGMSYDFLIGDMHRVTAIANFTANSFSQDQVGGGLEYSLNELFQLRAGYKYEFGSEEELEAPIYTGLSAGASISLPLSKENKDARFSIDYAYRTTKVWSGTHNIGIRFNI